MKPANAIGFLTSIECEHAHAEAFVGIGVLAAHVHKVIPADAEFCGILAHVFAKQTFVEVVMTGRDRGVNGVQRRSAYKFEGHIEIKTVLLNIVYQTLQVQQCSMSFVAVVQLAVDSKFLKHQYTADTEEIFLLDTVFPITAIELVSDGTVELAVHVEVCIHQIQFHTAYVDAPDVAIDNTTGIGNFQNHGMTVGIHNLLYRKLVEVLRFVVGDLLTVHAQGLGKIAEAVKETYGSHVHTAVGCFLDIVAGKYAETAGINLQAVAQAIFHRKIGNRRNILSHGFGHIFLKIGIYLVELSHEVIVG